jgi:hypothetical protein
LALNVIPLPYGLRDVKITPYVDAAATTLAGASIDLTNSQTFSWTESEDYETLRGDDSDVATHGKGAQIQWELASGGLSFEAYAAMAGGTVGTTGTTPHQALHRQPAVLQGGRSGHLGQRWRLPRCRVPCEGDW